MTLVFAAVLLTTPAFAEISRDELKKALQRSPDIVLDVLRENKKAFFDIVQEAAQEHQQRRAKAAEEAEQKALEEAFKNPLEPEVGGKTRVRGDKNAKYTLVEYSDFQCPYCQQGYHTVEALRKKYGKDLRFVFKHMPLSFHPQAMPAAQHMEAAALQSQEKAWLYHDKLFENQSRLGPELYQELAKTLGLDWNRMKKDVESEAVKKTIEADINEAKKFGFTGTPGFLLNGIPVRGAYPIEHFESIIERLGKQN